MIGLVSHVEWVVYEVCPSDMYLQVRQSFRMGISPGPGWLGCVRLRRLALTRKSLRLLLRLTSISYNGWSFKDATVGMK